MVQKWNKGIFLLENYIKYPYLCRPQGLVAEWLGRALQKLPHQFESGRDLEKTSLRRGFFIGLRLERGIVLSKREGE